MTGKSVEWEGPIDQACTLGRSARCPAWRTVWAGRLELLPKVRAWSIGPPHPTLLPVTALWPNTVFGALAQLEGGKRGLLTQHFFWSNSPTGHQIEEALFFRVSFLPPYRETRLPNGCSRYPRDGKIYVNLFFTATQLCLGGRPAARQDWKVSAPLFPIDWAVLTAKKCHPCSMQYKCLITLLNRIIFKIEQEQERCYTQQKWWSFAYPEKFPKQNQILSVSFCVCVSFLTKLYWRER